MKNNNAKKPATATATEDNAADEMFGDRASQAQPRAWFTSDCDGKLVGVAYEVNNRRVADPNKPGETKPARSLVIRLTKPCEGKLNDEITEIPAGAEIEVFVAARLNSLADKIVREPHGIVMLRGEKRKSPRGYMVQDWEVNALPARLCKGLTEELVAELTEAHRLAKEAQPSDEEHVEDGDDEAPF